MTEAFPISGNIDPKAFPFLLMELHRQGATGSLKVEGPAYPKALYFRSGRILFGSSNDPKDQLGSILIESGKITQEQLDDVNTKVGPGNPLAKVLAESGFVNQRELGEAARVKVERILSDVIAYTSGSFEFEDGVLPKGAVDLKLSTEKLVLAAVLRLTDRGFVLRHLDSLGVVLEATPDLETRLSEIRTEAGGLPERLDAAHTLKEAAAMTRLDEFEAAKVACALLFLGLVRKAAAPAASVGAPAEGGTELDLAQTARMAFEEPPGTAAAPAADSAFFMDESSAGGEIGFAAPSPAAPEPPSESFPMPEPEPAGFTTSGPEPSGFAMAEPSAFPPSVPSAIPAPDVAPASFAAEETAFLMPSSQPSAPEPGTGRYHAAAAPFESPAPPAPSPPSSFDLETVPEGIPTIGSPMPSPPVPPAPEVPSFKVTEPSPPSYNFGAEEETPADTLPPSRPSKEDLAALDALLNPSASRGPAQPLGRTRADRWEPQFRPQAVARKPARRRETSRLLLYGLPALLVVGTGVGAWYYFNVIEAPPAPPRRVATAAPTTVAAPPPPTVATAPTPAPTSPAGPSVGTGPSPSAPAPSAAPAAPPSAAPVTPPTPRPAAPTTPGPGPGGEGATLAEARSLLQKGSFAEAARGFAASLKVSRQASYSVQVLVACSTETVQKAVENVPGEDLFILPVSYKGRSCYRMGWGLYDSEDRANAALRSLPEYFRKGGATPKVAPTAGMLP